MKQHPLVGRSEALQNLNSVLTQGWNNHGGIVFIEGVAGMGKTMVLKMLQEQTRQFPEFEKTTFTYGYCYESTGSQSAYQPFIEILETLTRAEADQKNVAKLMLTLVKETAPDWLQVIPTLGPAVRAGVKSASIVGQWFLETRDEKQTSQSSIMASQYINMLIKIASQRDLLVLVIEDAHWIDDASCQLLLRLSYRISERPIVVLVTYRPDHLSAQHPLQRVQREMLIKNNAQVIRLTGLSEVQIQTYVQKRFGSPLNPKLAAWLEHLCKGNPLFVTQYLSLLEQDQIIRREGNSYLLNGDMHYLSGKWIVSGALASVLIPDSIEAVLEQRIERLLEEDRELLQLGAVQGDFFMSSILAELLAKRELDILSQLRRVIERQRIISFYVGVEWLKKKSEFYIFEHHLMQQAFYNKLSPRERALYHHSVAEILEHIFKELLNPSRRLMLEVALHYSLGDEPVQGTHYYFLAAQSSFSDGAFLETIELCKRALECLKQVDGQDRMFIEVIQLLLIASEIRWRGKPELQGELPITTLAEEAEAAALRIGDLALLAQTKYLKGRVILVTESRSRCVFTLRDALKTAQQVRDQLGEFVIMSELGHHLVGENLTEGLTLLFQAHDLYTRMIATQAVPQTKVLERYFHRLQGLIGIAEFDQGKFDEAEKWLKESIAGLKRLGMRYDLPGMFNFLSQLYIAMGLFEDAERVLKESVDLLKEEDEPSSFKGRSLALLGKLYIEWNRIEDAIGPLLKGWEETQATWNVAVVPLVRNYYAELLMHPNYRARNFAKAKQLLDITLEESRTTDFHRSAIAALSLHSQLALTQGLIDTALSYSTQAVGYLERMGIMPALRTEEVLFNHYLALKANKREREAIHYLGQAHAIVLKKAESIKNPDHQRAFMERVPVSKAILTAFENTSAQELLDATSAQKPAEEP